MKKRFIIPVISIMVLSLLLSGCGAFKLMKKAASVYETMKENESDEEAEVVSQNNADENESSDKDNLQNEDVVQDDEVDIEVSDRLVLELNEGSLVLIPSECDIVSGDCTLTIPASWAERVYVEVSEYGVYFYQKMSYDKFQGGFLTALCSYDNNVPNYTGETMVAYTDDIAYYFSNPSDVPFDYEDEDNQADYIELSMDIQSVVDSLNVNQPNVKYDADEYLAPMSSLKLLEEGFIEAFDINDINTIRDEIYARHGQIFDDELVQYYFESMSWYEGKTDTVRYDDLSDIEKKNVDYISGYLEDYYNQKSGYPKEVKIGESYTDVFTDDAAGVSDTVTYRYEGSYETGFTGFIKVYKHEWNLETDFGITLESPQTGYYYIHDTGTYRNDKFILVVDMGMDDNYITYFFGIDGAKNLFYIGPVEGCPIKGINGNVKDGLSVIGDIISPARANTYGLGSYYKVYWYNSEDKCFEDASWGLNEMVPSMGKTLKKDIKAYTNQLENTEVTLKKGTKVYFCRTDDAGLLEIKEKETGKKYIVNYASFTSDLTDYFD